MPRGSKYGHSHSFSELEMAMVPIKDDNPCSGSPAPNYNGTIEPIARNPLVEEVHSLSCSLAEQTNDIEIRCGSSVVNQLRQDGVDPNGRVVVEVQEEEEEVCRICYSPLDVDCQGSPAVVELGCQCKGHLSRTHLHCAQRWYKLRGNGICEICGATTTNVIGILVDAMSSESATNQRVTEILGWHKHPFINLLMILMVGLLMFLLFLRVAVF